MRLPLLTTILFFSILLILSKPSLSLAQENVANKGDRIGNIFEGASPGLFSGFSNFFQGFFGEKAPVETGGAQIPIKPIVPLTTPSPNAPASPDAGDYLKLSLTWDALSIGQENGDPLKTDPLAKEHDALVQCCGVGEDPENGGCVRSEPIHVLWGWCGQGPNYTKDLPKAPELPFCEDIKDPNNKRCIPRKTPGPNDKTYDKAISNKYIRRDGYLFKCTSPPMCVLPASKDTLTTQGSPFEDPKKEKKEKPPGKKKKRPPGGATKNPEKPPKPKVISIWNYTEFQTEIYHSNDFSLFLNVENRSDHPIENIQVTYHPLTYSAVDLLYSLPHNVNFPTKLVSTDGYRQQQPEKDGRVPVFPQVKYQHSQQLTPFSKQIVLDGKEMNWKNLPPFEIGPFNLKAHEKRVFPLQPSDIASRNEIPLSDDTPGQCFDPANPGESQLSTSSSPKTFQPQRACLDVCDMVRLHDIWGMNCTTPLCNNPTTCPSGCPTISQCEIYYGLWKGTQNSHPEGSKCDQNCETVPGCPPSYCFEGNRCGIDPNPASNPECSEVYDKINNDNQHYRTCSATGSIPQKSNGITSMLNPKPAEAVGCYGYPPICPARPPQPAGCGSLTPRDYNLTCDPNDSNESIRCKGGGNKGVIPKVPDSQNRHLEFRDVTALGGCGYEASSNNSVIGPILFEAEYGKTQSSRSTLLASIPIGGPILDDEARPYGWPASGKIQQDWGATQSAQELGPFSNFMPETSNHVGDDYLLCPNNAKTYPPRANNNTSPIGKYVHPGIDIAPNYQSETDINVYSTHAGWITFAGVDPKSPKSGWTVQIESDVTQDGMPDFITRYEHLLQNSIQVDTQYGRAPFKIGGTMKPMGTGVYVPRNALIGKIGDTGSPGNTQLHYEIIDKLNFTKPQSSVTKSGDVTYSLCSANPYSKMKALAPDEGLYFTKDKFYTPAGNPVKGPVYRNP